jgi:3-oxoacyl-[acyl-carrier-protein] synthase II
VKKFDVVITGIGLVSCLGEGRQAHAALFDGSAAPRVENFGPFMIHPLCEINFDLQIPKKGDQRQMELWQRIGVYAAGLALQDAGLAGNAELLAQTHLIVAADGGERDETVDNAIMSGIRTAENKGAYLNERLMNDLRPTLFLAQLTNLMAGNISIVHGVTGSSRSFMGEEAAGVDAIRTLYARIASGQAQLGLVGGANNAARKDIALNYAFADALMKPPYQPVWSREGIVPGSMGAFLVLEEAEHAKARGARILARITHADSTRCTRAPGETAENLTALYDHVAPQLKTPPAVLSCASGMRGITREEDGFWQSKNAAVRAFGSMVGHGLEAQAPFACALAALSLSERKFFAPFEDKEKPLSKADQILVSCCGHWRGEGLILLEEAA